MARTAPGVVKFFPATLAIANSPVSAAVRNERKVRGRPSGKNTAAA